MCRLAMFVAGIAEHCRICSISIAIRRQIRLFDNSTRRSSFDFEDADGVTTVYDVVLYERLLLR